MKEYYEYGDILIGNFIDTYNNLTLKSRAALNFFFTSCQSKALILMDDDIVIRHSTFFNNSNSKLTV